MKKQRTEFVGFDFGPSANVSSDMHPYEKVSIDPAMMASRLIIG